MSIGYPAKVTFNPSSELFRSWSLVLWEVNGCEEEASACSRAMLFVRIQYEQRTGFDLHGLVWCVD